MNVIFAIFALLVSFFANAETANYSPFVIKDPQANSRSEVRSALRSTSKDVDGITLSQLVTEQFADIDVTLYKDVWEIMDRVARSQDLPRQNLASPSCPHYRKLIANALVSQVQTIPACATVLPTAQRIATNSACQEIAQPESFVRFQPPGVVRQEDLHDIVGLIKTAGEVFLHFQLPNGLVTPQKLQEMREILVKLRSADLENIATMQIADFDAILKDQACASNKLLAPRFKEIQAARDEVAASLSYVRNLDQIGRTQAAADLQRLASMNRTRELLPYPNLSDKDRETLSLWVGGLYWRMRGGGLIGLDSTRKARQWFNLFPLEVIGYISGGKRGHEIASDLHSRISKGWGEFMDMGTTPGENDVYHDLAKMTERGFIQVDPALDELEDSGFWGDPLIVGAASMGPCYYYSIQKLSSMKVQAGREYATEPYRPLIDGFTAWGELCSGASISLGFARSLMLGVGR